MLNKKTALVLISFSLLFKSLYSQEEALTEDLPVEEEIVQREEKLEAVLPRQNSSIIFVEGEDAVSTNFNREPILNYSSSGFRTLQLNQYTELHGEATYNSDYVFYAEEDGVYELWYGGTPAGNRDETLTSYASPFRYVLDGIYTTDVYREDMHVVEEYAPSYYWNYVQDITLSAGDHRIKFEVLQKRSLDGKYFFYLDNFFLVKKENGQRVISGEVPEIFPKDLDNRSIDSYFQSFEEYEVLIRDNPEVVGNYVFLAKIYSLAGDYLNALKYLRRASFLEPDDPDIMLLTAKNMIWRGSTSDGLFLYSELLEIVPERIDLWTEAGKIAGWTGQYHDSINFFEGGLKILPDDLSLLTNLGITNLWLGEVNQAEKHFEKVQKIAGDDLDLNRELAQIFRINGYSDKAVPIYRHMINLYPEVLELYFDLEETYAENDQRDKIAGIRSITEDTFIADTAFSKSTGIFYESQSMKEKVIEDYEEQLQNDPENLSLRRILAEIYFWNGFKEKAISEYRNILTNYTYLNLLETEKEMIPFLELLDRNYALSHFMKDVPSYIEENSKKLIDLLKRYESAKTALESLRKKNDTAESKGKSVDRTGESAKKDEIFELEEELAVSIYINESYIEKFNSLSSQFADEKENLIKLQEDEKASTEVFAQLMEGVDWNWDRLEMFDELDEVKRDNVILGNYVAGKIYQFEGQLTRALSNFAPMIKEEYILPTAPFALYETEIWLGDEKRIGEIYEQFSNEIDSSVDYIYYLNDYLDYLYLEEEDPFGYLTEEAAESVKQITDSLDSLKEQSSDLSKELESNIEEIHKILISNMERGFYNLASETYLLRNELGDFYYNEKRYPEAISQFKQVLVVDPWNLAAKFKLAQVYHYNGDWSNALDIYGDIYEEDSQYNNVATFYNELTREYADSVNFNVESLADTSSLVLNFHADYNVLFNRILGMTVEYNAEHNRYYYGTDESSFLYHNVNLKFPMTFSRLTLTPEVGVYYKTDLIDSDGEDETLSLSELISEHSYLYPRGGADLVYNHDSFSILGGYRFDWEDDSFHPTNDSTYYHLVNLQVGVNFLRSNIPFIEDTSIFLSGETQFYEDDNFKWYGSATVSNNIQLLREPAMYLNWSLDFSLEDALETSDNYWTPEMSLLTGVNLEYKVELPLADGKSLEEKVWFNTDIFSNGSDDTMGLTFETGNRLSYIKKDFTTFLDISGSFTKQLDPTASGIKYWSLSVEFGVNVLLPDLLTP